MADGSYTEPCVGSKRDHQVSSTQNQEESPDFLSVSVSPKEEASGESPYDTALSLGKETSPKNVGEVGSLSFTQKDRKIVGSVAVDVSLPEMSCGFFEKGGIFGEDVKESGKSCDLRLVSGCVHGVEMCVSGIQEPDKPDVGFSGKKVDERDEKPEFDDKESLDLGETEKPELDGIESLNFGENEEPVFVGKESLNLEENEVTFGGQEVESESLLEAEKKRLLAELEVGTIFKDNTHVEKVTGFSGIVTADKKGNGCQDLHKTGENCGRNADFGRALKFEMIDGTALIDMLPVQNNGNGLSKRQEIARADKDIAKNHEGTGRKPVDEKQSKNSKRKGKRKAGKMATETDEGYKNSISVITDFRNRYTKDPNDMRIAYSSKYLESLRFAKLAYQRQLWREIYNGLAPDVRTEYDNLASLKNQRNSAANSNHQQPIFRRDPALGILGEHIPENVGNETECTKDSEVENANLEDPVEEDDVEDDDSDDDYNSILKPAFVVEGEPDFDSGPPEDGFEYLRRVRWEAAQIPNVKVAKIDRTKFAKEQSVYMPQIPEISKCPEHLLPLKEWEDAFLSDFSNLRLALSELDASGVDSGLSRPMFKADDNDDKAGQLPENFLVEKFNNLSSSEGDTSLASDRSVDQPLTNPKMNPEPKISVGDGFGDYPTLSAIHRMDSVTRVSMLRKRINSVEAMSTLSRSDCSWLFALCAAVDTPLDADTCASLRGLLRKCASVRAGKPEVDDEVIMANILATITGRYYAQMEA